MNTPYTTKSGLKIGSRYRENGITMPIDDKDMLLLQMALICPQIDRKERLEDLFVKGCVVIFLFFVFYKFIFR
jgi:hypothetical protein